MDLSIYPCGCSHLKVEADQCSVYDTKGDLRLLPLSVLVDLLSLVMNGKQPDLEVVFEWTDEQREQAEIWAGSVHLSASDNEDIVVPEKPDFLC